MKAVKYLISFLIFAAAGCSSLILKPADFAWPIESVLKVNEDGNVQEKRFSLSFNSKELFLKETGDSLGYQNKNLHVIRGYKGFYFMTSDNFKNVYVFDASDASFKLENKIEISDSAGIENPAFNQRSPYIELIYGDKKINLTDEGIAEEKWKI